ncbi:hypothetical protein PN451_16580 [Dolichospermum planctonicum CS-1226]|uniref:Uncharacterized protein n=1 Tax=Dolichospermum planctonicum CS-1226 TaxID=3021751 RepID=A0ABT5AJF0_9CYAN|nr:hypothetical protein [Dolichospermum planctonicum]MDB9537424.1 hypothetical protein [Dolichospermum planctonicum CS-1226]
MPAPQEFHDSTLYLIREENAVSTVGRTETNNACGEMTLYSDLVTSLGKVAY